MDYRIEKDSMGEIQVPKRSYWGAQTQRSLEHFAIGMEKILQAIVKASEEILDGSMMEHFPLSCYWRHCRGDWIKCS